jgi:hypothetical protein
MKRIAFIGAVVVALACLCVRGAAQRTPHGGSPPGPSMPWRGNAQSNVMVILSPAGNPPLSGYAPARNPEFTIQTLPLSVGLQSPSAPPRPLAEAYRSAPSNFIVAPSNPPTIPAGVYQAAPYSCIVVVPGPQPDDRCVISPAGGVASAMPIIRPDVRLIPRAPAK